MRFRALALLAVTGVVVASLLAFDVGGVGSALGVQSRPPADPVIDGWVVGVERPDEPARIDVATELLANRYPGHAAVVRASVHDEGIYYDKPGQRVLWTRSGSCCEVVLFELADGSKRAVGTGSPGISQTVMAFETGPVNDGLDTSENP